MGRFALRLSRDATLGAAGILILFHETVVHDGPERITLIGAALALLGFPFFLRADERSQRADEAVPTQAPPNVEQEVARRVGEALIRRSIEEQRREEHGR